METTSIGIRPGFLPEGTYWPCPEGITVQRINMLTQQVGKHILPCTLEQFEEGRRKARQGDLMQDAFPFLTPPDREFLISGIPPLQWAELFPVPLPFSPSSVEQILAELRPVMDELFGGTASRPLAMDRLVEEVSRDFEPLLDEDQTKLQHWVQQWALQQGLILAE
ncbi:hypothetical protein [Spirosoma sp.]|uniref:hypothetical protein n=1 Tax=Spirosoma sp. TaxID=1899569 RepID=UPI0026382D6E|nr:hypothetical protein [Spirosoma sp.]MCX6213750.1 hypothetical protein [Spirosoma sp.]